MTPGQNLGLIKKMFAKELVLPLIEPERKGEPKEPWRIRLRSSVAKEILAYCDWSGICYRDTFVEKACLHIFSEDKEWQVHKANHREEIESGVGDSSHITGLEDNEN